MRGAMGAGWRVLAMVGVLCGVHGALAQAPAGSTGQCNDGSYTTAAKKWQSCRGHQGVKLWFADAGAAPASAAGAARSSAAAPTSAPASTAATAPAAPAAPAASAAPSSNPAVGRRLSPEQRAGTVPQAAGGGAGLVWVNTDSKVYHCEGTPFYGRTRSGKYMSEADAKTAGARPDRGKVCSK